MLVIYYIPSVIEKILLLDLWITAFMPMWTMLNCYRYYGVLLGSRLLYLLLKFKQCLFLSISIYEQDVQCVNNFTSSFVLYKQILSGLSKKCSMLQSITGYEFVSIYTIVRRRELSQHRKELQIIFLNLKAILDAISFDQAILRYKIFQENIMIVLRKYVSFLVRDGNVFLKCQICVRKDFQVKLESINSAAFHIEVLRIYFHLS